MKQKLWMVWPWTDFSSFSRVVGTPWKAVLTFRSLITQRISKNWCLNYRRTSDGVELQMTSWSCKPGPWIAKLGLSPTLFSENFLKPRSLHLAQERPQQVSKLPVNGPLGRHRHRSQSSSFFVKVDPQLQQMVEEFYNRDFTGSIVDDRTEMPQDERRFMKNAEETVELRDGHYQISLPFKDRVALVPNNTSQALRRANRLKKKLERDPELCADYKAFMGDIVAKGYARKSDES